MVPDLALLGIFDFYMTEALDFNPFRHNSEAWIILAHVCRKWRDIVFGSPSRLNVRLLFKARRSVKAMLDTWPPFLIDIWGSDLREWNVDNIVAALEHTDRIDKIELWDDSLFHVERTLAAMQKPFPSLTELVVYFFSEMAAIVPDSLLSGSAPLLRSLRLKSTQFPLPQLQNLILSATNLVELSIWSIPNSGLISPEAMVTCLSRLKRLEEFELGVRSPRIWTSRHLSPSTRCVLPALTSLRFKGSCEYLEDLIASLDSPLLDNLDVSLLHQPRLASPQLARFVDRTPKLKALHEAYVFFRSSEVYVSLPGTRPRGLDFRIKRVPSDHFSVMAQLCTLSILRILIPMIKRLYIVDGSRPYLFRLNGIESSHWLDLLGPFTTVEVLYLSREFSPHIVSALHGIIGEGTMEVLPSLQNLFLEQQVLAGRFEEDIKQFVSALHLSSRPMAVLQWDREWFFHKY